MSFGGFDPNLARARRARRVTPPPVQNLLAAALREREVAPEENPYRPAEPEPQATLPNRVLPEYDETQSATRPRVADPEQFTEDRIGVLSAMPLEPVSGRQRVGRFLQKFGEAQLAQPMARSGLELAGTAARSAGYGVNELSGDTAAREMRQEEIGQNQQSLLNFEQARQRRAQRQAEAVKQAQGLANLAKTDEEVKALRSPRPNYERVETPGGYVYVDRNNPSGAAVPTGLKAPAKPGARPQTFSRRNADGSTTLMERGEDGKWKESGVTSAGEPTVSMRLPTGQVVQVSPSAAVGAAASGGKVVADANNQTAWRQYEIQKAQVDRENALAQKRYEDIEQAVGQLQAAVAKAQEAANKMRNPPAGTPATDRTFYNGEYDDAMKRVRALAGRVKQLDPRGELVQDDPDTRWPLVLGQRPDPKGYPDPPTVSLPQGPEAVAPQGAYVGHTFKQSDLPEIQKRLKAKSPEEARRMVEAQGGTFQ
jgi:hypothetical protein